MWKEGMHGDLEVLQSMKGDLRLSKEEWKEVHYWEKWWSRLACWGSFRTTFFSQIASDHSAIQTKSGREWVPIPYGNRTRVFDMKRRCPNHWTKGTKKPFFIYLGVGLQLSQSFLWYTQFEDFLCLYLGDWWCEFGASSPLPPPMRHQPRPLLQLTRLNYERKKKILIDFQDKKALMMRLSVLFGKPINYESLRIQDYYNQWLRERKERLY